jgi:hypothetical protein
MTTLVRHLPGRLTADRDGQPGVRRQPKATAETRWAGGADPLSQEADLLNRAAQQARERGLTADEELALWLERSVHRMWTGAGGSHAAPELAAALAVARALTGEPCDPDGDLAAGPG